MTLPNSTPVDISALTKDLRSGHRAALARAITLIESRRGDHQARARDLVQALLPDTGRAIRVGITGSPGVGKSTTIDGLGMFLIERGHKVAVLAVDPSSARTGGSILGDKTRMARLSASDSAYIRPSPASGTLGGVAAKTREAMLLCEASGFDVVLVETVGIGQSETAVCDMTDFFLALMLPGAGDELQGIKKGLVELADMIAVNKADGDNIKRANLAAAEYRGALHILSPRSEHWHPPVLTYSALTGTGIDALWQKILDHRTAMNASGEFAARRRQQQMKWMWSMLEQRMMARLRADAVDAHKSEKDRNRSGRRPRHAGAGGGADRGAVAMNDINSASSSPVSARSPARPLIRQSRWWTRLLRLRRPAFGDVEFIEPYLSGDVSRRRSRAAGTAGKTSAGRAADVRSRLADAVCADRDPRPQRRHHAVARRRARKGAQGVDRARHRAAAMFGPHTAKLLRAAKGTGVDARASRDAGSYLCNYLSWRAIEAVHSDNGPRLAAFVHVPPLRAQRRRGRKGTAIASRWNSWSMPAKRC